MLTRRMVILAKQETTYGTDPAMTGANAILAYDVDLDIKGEVLERSVLRDSLSPMPHVIGMKECVLNFKTELKNCGIAPSLPEMGVLLTGCGFDTGVVSGTTVIYSLVSAETSLNSVSFLIQKDGNSHKILGSRGSAKFSLEAGKYGVGEFSFQGIYDPVGSLAMTDIIGLHTNKPPIVYNSSFNLAGFSPVCSKLEIDLGNTIARRESLNATYGVAGFRITDRKPTMNFDADAVVESSNPFWGDWSGHIVDTFNITIGSSAGNTVKFNGIFQYESHKYGDQDGVAKYDCKSRLVSSDANTQNDELKITVS
jgi:hypothetical protein